MQRFMGIVLGALATFIVLVIYDATKFSDAIPAYGIAVVVGAIVGLVWPWVVEILLLRRIRNRREDQIHREVERQLTNQS